MRYLLTAALLLVPLYLMAATASYNDARQAVTHCRVMVAQGAWPTHVCEAMP